MVSIPKKALKGNFSSISNIESFLALKLFTLSKTHLPGDAFLGSNNWFSGLSNQPTQPIRTPTPSPNVVAQVYPKKSPTIRSRSPIPDLRSLKRDPRSSDLRSFCDPRSSDLRSLCDPRSSDPRSLCDPPISPILRRSPKNFADLALL